MKVKHTRKRNMEAIGMRMVLFFFAVLLSTATRAVADPDPNFYIYLCLGQSNIEGGRTIEKRDLMGDPRFQFPADFDNPSRGWKKLRRTLGYKVSETKLPVTSTGNLTVQDDPDWTKPFPPFKIAGNLYYVGSKGLANYLITTPQGHILINSDLEANVPLIRASVERLGLKFTDIKVLLISHAHWDHDAGGDLIKKLTGAKYMVMDADVPVVESGGKTDFQYGNVPASLYTPTKVDRVLHDGDEVKLGGAVLVAHLTPGHTKGCTTWTMKVKEADKSYNVVVIGSPNVNPGYRLVNNAAYPQIAADYEKMFRVLKSLRCDIFLGAHGNYFDLETKYARLKEGAAAAFVDPEGYEKYVAAKEQAFKTELAMQRAALPTSQ
jgi:metallo-beta-lactamase class B